MNEFLEVNLSGGIYLVRFVDLQDFYCDISFGSIQVMCFVIKWCCFIFENIKYYFCYVFVDLFFDISFIRCEY